MTKTITSKIDQYQKVIFWSLISLVVILCSLYIFLVQSSVSLINERRLSQSDASDLEVTVSKLESDYLALSAEKVNLQNAYTLGFKDASKEYSYAVKTSKAVTLSYRAEPIQ